MYTSEFLKPVAANLLILWITVYISKIHKANVFSQEIKSDNQQ